MRVGPVNALAFVLAKRPRPPRGKRTGQKRQKPEHPVLLLRPDSRGAKLIKVSSPPAFLFGTRYADRAERGWC
jgi:hypothetical protein